MMGSVGALGTSTTGKSGAPEGGERKYALKASITWPMALASIPCIALLSIPVGGCVLAVLLALLPLVALTPCFALASLPWWINQLEGGLIHPLIIYPCLLCAAPISVMCAIPLLFLVPPLLLCLCPFFFILPFVFLASIPTLWGELFAPVKGMWGGFTGGVSNLGNKLRGTKAAAPATDTKKAE
ncbi:unnamed protein product [Vitrella brassicaformis CCMP3155]|uniref:Uncharacterized protein n=1 Tax=Vitrella brassicaformis (strain CCMP3155) TaxID=1169540 RepID=A0A0G4EFS9_VITBC|nr:unnamed protein product [Vitrella brassicaformis CCMP3155]|eukprot:CEL94240.1 unnamed protein product [Vitrella brassicaformis CCMP3155]